jgi:protoporphyrinogen oxidase
VTRPESALVLGGGLAGIAAAHTLALAGVRDVTVVERGQRLGGLAGTFHREGHFYPLAYHHVLHRDRTLLYYLDAIGALSSVRWRKIRMLFHLAGRLYDLSHPVDFLRFPMSLADKMRFARLMLRCFRKSGWNDWRDRSAAELVDDWAGPGVRRAIFEPLTHLKFDLPCDAASGAWLGARLHYREGSAPLGYIPGTNWTLVLCDGLTRLLDETGVVARTGARVTRLLTDGKRVTGAELEGGERLTAEVVVSALPTEVYTSLVPRDDTPELNAIRYTAILSAVCSTRQTVRPDFYWMNLASRDCTAGGIFRLDSLNPTIGAPGEACLNFVTHVKRRDDPQFLRGDDEIIGGYLDDFRRVFGFGLEPDWVRLHRLPMYSPVFVRGFHNPPARSTTWSNVYFAGNYRTFPSIASTGTALDSGIVAAEAVLSDRGGRGRVSAEVRVFRPPKMRRA